MDIIFAFIVLGLLVFIVAKIIYDNCRKFLMVCKNCGFSSKVKKRLRGNPDIEILLYLCGIIPGIIYTSWRYGKKICQCPHCGSMDMIPADSPLAQSLLKENIKRL